MSTSAQEIYRQVISKLSPTERLRLANLILNDLVEQNLSVIDYSDTCIEDEARWDRAFAQSHDLLAKLAAAALAEDQAGATQQ